MKTFQSILIIIAVAFSFTGGCELMQEYLIAHPLPPPAG
jgi:hypothetical protein